MIGNSLTLDNLRAIYEAMTRIKEIDRSAYFTSYLNEVEERIRESISTTEHLQKQKS